MLAISKQAVAPTSVLNQAPPDSQTRTAIGRQLREVSNAAAFHNILTTHGERFAEFLSPHTISSLIKASSTTYNACGEILDKVFRRQLKDQPLFQKNIGALKDALGEKYAAYRDMRALSPLEEWTTETVDCAAWPQKHLNLDANDMCSLQSPRGKLQVDFAMVTPSSCITKINLTFDNATVVVPLPPEHHLAHCGAGIPEFWDVDKTPISFTECFQPVALLPDEKTVVLLLEKKDHPAVLQKLQLNASGKWEAHCAFLPTNVDVSKITGLAGTDHGTLFVYASHDGKGGILHVKEEAKEWHSASVPPFVTDHYAIAETAPDGSSLVLTSHTAGKPPILITAKGQDGTYSYTYRALPRTKNSSGFAAPCLFAYSPDSRQLALTARHGGTIVEGMGQALVGVIDLDKPSETATAINMRDETTVPMSSASYQFLDPGMGHDLHSDRNASLFEFTHQGKGIRKATFSESRETMKICNLPLFATEIVALEKQASAALQDAAGITASQLLYEAQNE